MQLRSRELDSAHASGARRRLHPPAPPADAGVDIFDSGTQRCLCADAPIDRAITLRRTYVFTRRPRCRPESGKPGPASADDVNAPRCEHTRDACATEPLRRRRQPARRAVAYDEIRLTSRQRSRFADPIESPIESGGGSDRRTIVGCRYFLASCAASWIC